jgi:hypothetical protein
MESTTGFERVSIRESTVDHERVIYREKYQDCRASRVMKPVSTKSRSESAKMIAP